MGKDGGEGGQLRSPFFQNPDCFQFNPCMQSLGKGEEEEKGNGGKGREKTEKRGREKAKEKRVRGGKREF